MLLQRVVLKSNTGIKALASCTVQEIHSKCVTRSMQREAIEDQSYRQVNLATWYQQPERDSSFPLQLARSPSSVLSRVLGARPSDLSADTPLDILSIQCVRLDTRCRLSRTNDEKSKSW